MSTYAFSDVDFGIDNTDSDNFRGFIEVLPGSIVVARQRFSFPGVDYESVRTLGERSRQTTWQLSMIATDDSYLVTFESAMEALARSAATYALTQRGAVFPRAVIESNGFVLSGPRVPLQIPWAFGQRYTIRYMVLP